MNDLDSHSGRLWQIAVEAPISESLTYGDFKLPPEQQSLLGRGQLVNVPLGNRLTKGVVLNEVFEKPNFEIKSIASVDLEFSALPSAHVKWLEWLSRYYLHPVGQVFASSFPPLRKQLKERKSSRPPAVALQEFEAKPILTAEQAKCIEDISKFKKFSSHLLFGVTGSGKTEVYLRLLEEVLESGKSGLVLVPEISLTPQLVQRFAKRFGDKIAALHSQLTDRERTNQWWEIVDGKKSILIGARSALFCPIPNPGLIIVDEEHEPSFKQEEKLKYHGRDAAVMLAHYYDCPIVLGSATPSLETWKNTQEGKYHLHRLNNRVENRALPEIEVIDLRADVSEDVEKKKSTLPFWLTPRLHELIEQTLANKEQVALFLNRRGIAQTVVCPACGFTVECPNCDINLTLHGKSHLVCHYCDYHENLKFKCPDCKEGHLETIGLGTELIESDLREIYPDKNIARADRDEIQNRADLELLISDMESGKTDILVGTQMIAKGLDFPKLKLVGLVLADVGFNLPDFRSTERSFQLITQMSGRSGRHVKPGESAGKVVIQSFNCEHESILFSKTHDFEGFAKNELNNRQALNYPPLGRLASLRIQGTNLSRVEQAARDLAVRANMVKDRYPQQYASIEILGPAEAPLAKIRNQFRYHLLLKSSSHQSMNNFIKQILGDEQWLPSAVRILVDIDPMNLL